MFHEMKNNYLRNFTMCGEYLCWIEPERTPVNEIDFFQSSNVYSYHIERQIMDEKSAQISEKNTIKIQKYLRNKDTCDIALSTVPISTHLS